ncbi:MAG: GNAT family N-acetyltransferase [Halopseudomonas aestusnigri]
MVTEILRGDSKSISKIAKIFDLYRQHYGEKSDFETCVKFLGDRISAEESIIFFAQNSSGEAIGFTQAYPIFCSVPFRRDLFLGDLYVLESERGNGVGRQLLNAVKEYGIQINSKGTLLNTDVDNVGAQGLYESLGFKRDTDRYYYYLNL